MSAYINSGLISKAMLADCFTEYPLNKLPRWFELEEQAEKLDEALYNLRTGYYCRDGVTHPYTKGLSPTEQETARGLRAQLSKIEAEQQSIIIEENPRYASYWGLTAQKTLDR